jgi:ACS family sodium-dependent inorganic phosphate cotransporter
VEHGAHFLILNFPFLPFLITTRSHATHAGMTMPSMNNLLATYVPAPSRARSIGVIFSGFHGGTLLGLLLSPLVVLNFGWPTLFVAYGSLGIPLALAWQVRYV